MCLICSVLPQALNEKNVAEESGHLKHIPRSAAAGQTKENVDVYSCFVKSLCSAKV